MPRRVATEDNWGDEPDDGWEPDDEDAEWQPDPEDEDETVPCPHCEAPVYEGAEQCPGCGMYLSEEDAPPARKPWWIVLGIVLCLSVALVWALR